jgi:hypothetical protein
VFVLAVIGFVLLFAHDDLKDGSLAELISGIVGVGAVGTGLIQIAYKDSTLDETKKDTESIVEGDK